MGNCLNGDSRRPSVEASTLPNQQQSSLSRATDSASTGTSDADANAHRDVPVSQSARSAGGGGSRAPSQGSQATLNMRQPLLQRVISRTNAINQPNPPGLTDSRSLAPAVQPANRSERPAGREAALPASERTAHPTRPTGSARARIAQPASQRTEMTALGLRPRRTTPRGEMMNQSSDVDVVRTVPAGQGNQIPGANCSSGRLLGTRTEFSNVRVEHTAAQVSLARSRILGEELVDQRRYVPVARMPPPRESSRQTELLPRFGSGPGPRPSTTRDGPRPPTTRELINRQMERASADITILDLSMTYARTGAPFIPIRSADRGIQSASLDTYPRRDFTVTEPDESSARRVRATEWTSNLWRAIRHQGGSVERTVNLNEVESRSPKIRFQILFPAARATVHQLPQEDVIYEAMAMIIAAHNEAIPSHHARMKTFLASHPDQWALSHQILAGIGKSNPFLLLWFFKLTMLS
jgi:hypothetical protein